MITGYALFYISGLLQFTICKVALIPPGLTETADEGFLKELVEGERQFAPEFYTTAADVPAVVVHSYGASYVFQADRIEMTGDGFLESCAAFTIGSVEQTIASTVGIVVGKYAITVVHNAGDQFA